MEESEGSSVLSVFFSASERMQEERTAKPLMVNMGTSQNRWKQIMFIARRLGCFRAKIILLGDLEQSARGQFQGLIKFEMTWDISLEI